MVETGRTLVTSALRKAGITGRGIVPSNEDTNEALQDLNDMLSEWRTQRLMVWHLLNTGFVSDGRMTPYTIGPGATDYPMTPRPNSIESAYVLQLQNVGLPVSTPLRVVTAREEYDRIALKSLVSFPQVVFLDTSSPVGQLMVYPWPNAHIYAVHITTKDTLPVITLDTSLDDMPHGYIPAMKFNLARRLRQSYGKGSKPDVELNRMARNALSVVRAANLQLPEMSMPPAILRRGSGYNIYSDQFGY